MGPTPVKLADQSIDSKEYIKRYLAYTQSPTVQYESMITGGDGLSERHSSEE